MRNNSAFNVKRKISIAIFFILTFHQKDVRDLKDMNVVFDIWYGTVRYRSKKFTRIDRHKVAVAVAVAVA